MGEVLAGPRRAHLSLNSPTSSSDSAQNRLASVPPDVKPADDWKLRERCDRPTDGWAGLRSVPRTEGRAENRRVEFVRQ
jgi:hypothetical protein